MFFSVKFLDLDRKGFGPDSSILQTQVYVKHKLSCRVKHKLSCREFVYKNIDRFVSESHFYAFKLAELSTAIGQYRLGVQRTCGKQPLAPFAEEVITWLEFLVGLTLSPCNPSWVSRMKRPHSHEHKK